MPQNGSVERVAEVDFAAMLEEFFQQDDLEVGDVVHGEVLSVDGQGLIVGVGVHDGLVPRRDIERIAQTPDDYTVGDTVDVSIVRMEDDEGNLQLSVSQALQMEDWRQAETLMQADEIWEGSVIDSNRGGLIIRFGSLRGFVPASHVSDLPRGLNEDDRKLYLRRFVGGKLPVKVIEVESKRRRLVFSQRDATRENREARKEALLDQLQEGEVRKGVVSGMRDFGAFVDLGGADGLIHISELAWHRVKHPSDVLSIGDEVEVYILRLDNDGKRIGLSLKRLQPNPWDVVDEQYHVGQLIEGTVSRTANFGAFITMEPGIEALLHISQMSDPPPMETTLIAQEGQTLLMRIVSIETDKQRLGLSLKEVTAEELAQWQAQRAELETEVEA